MSQPRTQIVPTARSERTQSISATIIRACRACGEPGVAAYQSGSKVCMECGCPLDLEDKGVVWERRSGSLGARVVNSIRRAWQRRLGGG